MTMKKKMNRPINYNQTEMMRSIMEENIDEQLTSLFEKENGVDFTKQTPDEITSILLQQLGINRNE